MIKVDLITGFLGSGKSTFLKKYASYLIGKGEHICIMENDFGAVNVDMLLMQDLLGDQCDLEMVAGGCDKDCHKRRFKTKLISMGMRGFDRVLIEPSGIFDVDEFFDTLREEPLDQWYEIGNVIAVVDAKLPDEMSENADYLLASEVAGAGVILFSKVQEATEQEIERTKAHIGRAMQRIKCDRQLADVMICKDWALLKEEDYQKIMTSGYKPADHVKLSGEQDGFQSVYFLNLGMTEEKMRQTVSAVLQDAECGKIFRVKGFIRKDDKWLELNAMQDAMTVKEVEKGQEVLIVIGEELNEEKIRTYFGQKELTL